MVFSNQERLPPQKHFFSLTCRIRVAEFVIDGSQIPFGRAEAKREKPGAPWVVAPWAFWFIPLRSSRPAAVGRRLVAPFCAYA